MDNRIKGLVAGAAGAFATAATRLGAAAQDDTAAAGNGGTSDASANGGVIGIGDVNSGGNSGSGIAVGDVGSAGDVVCDKYGKCYHTDGSDAAVAIDGGDVTTSTSLNLSADGGVAISDASGGDDNDAVIADITGGDDLDFVS